LVAQAAISERREARLRSMRAQDRDGGEDADALATLHGVSAKAVAYLLGQLRATPALVLDPVRPAHRSSMRQSHGRGR
jgi:hypothetical protein